MFRRSIATVATALLLLGLAAASPASAQDPAGKLLMVLDSSGSMAEPTDSGQPKIDAAKAALTDVVGSLDPKAQVGMRVYGASVFDKSDPGACTDSQLVVPIGTGNTDALKAEIAKYKPYGETPIAYAVEQAGNDLGSTGQRSILLVSDGEETCSPDPCPVAEKLAAQGIDLRIDVIGLKVSGKARDQLSCIAEKGNGEYSDVGDVTELKERLSEAKDRATKPFELGGTPVGGAPDAAAAPPISEGRWSDSLPPNEQSKFYRIERKVENSTIWVGLSAPTSRSGANGIALKVKSATDDRFCDTATAYAHQTGDASASLVTGMVTTSAARADACHRGDVVLEVERRAAEDGDFQLDVYEEPPVADPAALPEVAGEPTWEPMDLGTAAADIAAGQSFEKASVISPDTTYRTDIVPGEIQVMKVDADWGQRVQVLGHTAAVPEYEKSYRQFEAQILSPWGGSARSTSAQGNPAPANVGAHDNDFAAATKEIRYNNRADWVHRESLSTAVPGEYFIIFTLERSEGLTTPVPITFQANLVGEAGKGAPPYAGAKQPTGSSSEGSQPSAGPEGEQQQNPEQQTSEQGASRAGLYAGIGVGAVVLAALIGGGVWLLRRRG